jgi:hypothetical protein
MSTKRTPKSLKSKTLSKSPGTSPAARRLQQAEARKRPSAKTKGTMGAAKPGVLHKIKGMEREGGPRQWLYPILESAYTQLVPRSEAGEKKKILTPKAGKKPGGKGVSYKSRLQPGRGEDVLADAPQTFWLDRLGEYKRRKAARHAAITGKAVGPKGAAVAGQKNWLPLGPSVVIHGQAQGLPSVGGRIAGIAVAPGGAIVYAASANGGVFRTDDGGMTWRSLMDAFDLDPTNFASTTLACGAIAIDANDPNRVYVGTGEGNTNSLFSSRIVNSLPAYRGVGPVRSDDGGKTWKLESTAAGSPSLAGKAFYALAVDPANRENVIGATNDGLYQRVPKAGGGAEWVKRRAGIHSSVVASVSGATKFFAAEWGKGVVQSTNGSTWSAFGTSFPTGDVGRIELGVQPNNPNALYAMVTTKGGALRGVFRRNGAGVWKKVSNAPDVLPVDDQGGSQGDYDLAIAVDPADANLIYLGGSYFNDPEFWPASVWRCSIQASGSGYKMAGASIGVRAHADVHVLVHAPGDPNALWLGCDGGIFVNRDPRGSGNFASRNDGLACLCPNYFAQHPTDPSIIFCGLQDNGTARTNGGPIWRHVNGGDGGYCVINWANPKQVIVFANGAVYRATDGGQDHNSWSAREFPWSSMTEPIVSPPYNPTKPADANLVALGSGQSIYMSTDFGASWLTANIVPIPTNGGIFAMRFASASRLFVGTTVGEVFRLDRTPGKWNVSRLDDVAGGPLGLHGLVSDVAVDWADPSLASIYLTFGGAGDRRRVWHFDGTRWEARSGSTGANNLLDVEHNAIAVDRAAPDNVYVGADIGVWHSPDRGASWEPLPNGLPDAPVFDVQIHPTRRLLRASTHGRGLYEYQL